MKCELGHFHPLLYHLLLVRCEDRPVQLCYMLHTRMGVATALKQVVGAMPFWICHGIETPNVSHGTIRAVCDCGLEDVSCVTHKAKPPLCGHLCAATIPCARGRGAGYAEGVLVEAPMAPNVGHWATDLNQLLPFSCPGDGIRTVVGVVCLLAIARYSFTPVRWPPTTLHSPRVLPLPQHPVAVHPGQPSPELGSRVSPGNLSQPFCGDIALPSSISPWSPHLVQPHHPCPTSEPGFTAALGPQDAAPVADGLLTHAWPHMCT